MKEQIGEDRIVEGVVVRRGDKRVGVREKKEERKAN